MSKRIYRQKDSYYSVCADCGKFVKLNKCIFGSLHFCIDSKGRNHYQRQIDHELDKLYQNYRYGETDKINK